MQADIRKSLSFVAFFWAAVAALFAGPVFAAETPKGAEGIMAPGPDIEVAVQLEYDGVQKKGTREAYERFIRRHPDHPLAEKAREALAKGNMR